MTQEQNEYLESIGITGQLLDKVNNIAAFYSTYLECQIEGIFVSEYITQEGVRMFENLWFFNENFCYEAKRFNEKEDYDCDLIKNNIQSFTIQKIDFDIITNVTNVNSRMFLEFNFKHTDRIGDMKASRENCKQLSLILKKYIQPNFGTEI